MRSIGHPLPKRDNLVLTHAKELPAGWTKIDGLDGLQRWLDDHPTQIPIVIGGARVFRQLLPFATKLYRTVILHEFPTDTKMPPINYDQWYLQSREEFPAEGKDPAVRFEAWNRR